MASLSYVALDANYDPIFVNGTALTGVQAVSQAILTRLKLLLGEWWEDLNAGLPVFQVMLGQLESPRGRAAMQLAVQQVILGTPYVTAVTDVKAGFNNGQFYFIATAQTAFGPTTVSSLPGASASLGSS